MDRAEVQKARIRWIDTARGAAIFLVVLSHSTKIALFLVPGLADKQALAGAARPMVLGLFFLSSGLLGGRIMTDPRQLTARVVGIGWLLLVWVLILGLWLAWAMPPGYGGAVRSPADYAAELAAPDSPAWFLLALAVCTVYGALTCRLSLAAGIALAVALSIATLSDKLPGLNYGWSQTLINLPIFLTGTLVFSRTPALHNPSARTAILLILFGTALAIPLNIYGMGTWGLRRGVALFAGMWPATAAAIGALALISEIPAIQAIVARTGKRTLAILVLHIIFLTLLVPLGLAALPAYSLWPVLSVLLLASAIAVVLSLAASAIFVRAGLLFLFLPPGPMRTRFMGSIGGIGPTPVRKETGGLQPGGADRWFSLISRRFRRSVGRKRAD